MNLNILIHYLVAAISASLPIPFIKKYTLHKNIKWLFFALVSYCVLIHAYIIILNDTNITIVYPIVKVISILLVISFGIFMFENKVTYDIILGIVLAILSIYLLSKKI
jgi:multidrug transporter EmrE-like cation transporter